MDNFSWQYMRAFLLIESSGLLYCYSAGYAPVLHSNDIHSHERKMVIIDCSAVYREVIFCKEGEIGYFELC